MTGRLCRPSMHLRSALTVLWSAERTAPPAPSGLPSVILTMSAPGTFKLSRLPWLAYVLPGRRFAITLAGADARLGADAVCYSFIAVDFHHTTLCRVQPAHQNSCVLFSTT
jgi:hypothetical protein